MKPEIEVRRCATCMPSRWNQHCRKPPARRRSPTIGGCSSSKQLDAVLVGTPTLAPRVAVDALNAAGRLLRETPGEPREDGPEIVRAARVNQRICRSVCSSAPARLYLEARDKFVSSGLLASLTHVGRLELRIPRPLPAEPREKATNLDWCASWVRQIRDWKTRRTIPRFRAFLDFGGGKMTDFGAPRIDVVQHVHRLDAPLSVAAQGGVFYDFHDGRHGA